jgi:predicted murein hydrolase (TIGR00659 family)
VTIALALLATLLVHFAAEALARRVRSPLLHPILVSTVVLAAGIRLLGIDPETYAQGGDVLTFFLGPSVVALGVRLEAELERLGPRTASVVTAIGAGSVVGVASVVIVARLLGASPVLVATLAPKSTTTPFAMAIAARLGGVPELAAAVVVAVGILGAAIGPPLLRLFGVRDRVAWGLALGAAAHGVGTARAVEEGDVEGASATVALGLTGVITALVAPPIVRFLASVW